METSTTLEWVKRPNGDWVTTNGLYVIPANKSSHYHLIWAEDGEQLSDRHSSIGDMKALAQTHMDQCVKAGQEAVADVAVPPEQVQAVAEEESQPDTQSLVSSDPDATADYPSESMMALVGVEKHSMVILGLPNVDNISKPIQEGIAEVVETDTLAETLVDESETVDEVLAADIPPILPTPEQIEAATIAVETMPLAEYKKETPTLVWIPIPQPKVNDTSVWTLWLSECGKYRVHLSCDTLGGADHYFGASVRKPIGVKRLDSVEFGAWDAVDHGRSGFVRYKTLIDALEAVAHHFREATEQPDYAPNNDDVLAYAGQHDLLKLPEAKQKDKKAVFEPPPKPDNKSKAKSVPSKTEEKSVMKISEKEARSMCVAVGYKSIGDVKSCPLTKVQHRINTTLLSNVDDLEVPEHDDDKKVLKRVLEALRKGQEVVVISDVLDDTVPEEDAATEKAARADKGDKKKGKDKPAKKAAEPKAATETEEDSKPKGTKNGHARAGKKAATNAGDEKKLNKFGSVIGSNNAKVDAVLSKKPKKFTVLCEESGLSSKQVRYSHLNDLVASGHLVKTEDGWKLA